MLQQAESVARPLLMLLAIVLFVIMTDISGFAYDLSGWLIRNLVFANFIAFSFTLALRPSARDLIAMSGAVLAVLIAHALGVLVGRAPPIALGSAWLAAILPPALRRRDCGAVRLRFVMVTALLLPVASTLALIGQQLTTWHAKTFDVPAYLADASYGFSASAVLGRIVWAHPPIHKLLGVVYGWLPAAVSTCYVLKVRAGQRDAAVLLWAALAGGAAAFFLYHAYPAAGPAYAFGSAFPAALPDPASLAPLPAGLAVPGAARNCMPSVHLAWALLAVIEARRLHPACRAAFALFAGLTAVATLALGEHYLIDLVVAVPFTVAVRAVCGREGFWLAGWQGTALAGGLLTASWLVFLRVWTPPAHVSPTLWLLTAATLAASALLPLGRLPAAANGCRQHDLRISTAPDRVEAG